MTPSLLDVNVQAKRFAERRVLDDIRFRVAPGEIVSLVGASGCGKSSLLRIVAGIDREFSGRIELAGRPLDGLTREIGFVFQEPRLFPWLDVAANVAFELGPAGRGDSRVATLLAEVGLAGHAEAFPKQLSGGQAQRVAIARGLFSQPRLLLLDEPFSAVDAFTRMALQDLLQSVARQHAITVLMVTHDIDEACLLSDRVLVMASQPGRLQRVVDVPFVRPRDRGDARLAGAKAEVLDALRQVHAI